MGSQNDRNVRGSQSFLMMMIHPMISPRTRSSSAATQPGQRPAPAAAAAALTTRRPARLRTVTAEGPAMPNACARRSGGARSSVGRGAFVSWAGRVCQLGGARSSVGRGAFVSCAGADRCAHRHPSPKTPTGNSKPRRRCRRRRRRPAVLASCTRADCRPHTRPPAHEPASMQAPPPPPPSVCQLRVCQLSGARLSPHPPQLPRAGPPDLPARTTIVRSV
jgi:hypothetical protein